MVPPTSATVAIIGAGAAGLITAHTLLRDGFEHVQVLTRDPSAGGVWAAKRVYPGLSINKSVLHAFIVCLPLMLFASR